MFGLRSSQTGNFGQSFIVVYILSIAPLGWVSPGDLTDEADLTWLCHLHP